MKDLLQSSTQEPIIFGPMLDSADHRTPKTGLTPTVTIWKPGGSFASPAGAVSEVGNGFYQIAGNATDTNTLGTLIVNATASGADQFVERFQVVAVSSQVANLPANVIQWKGSTPNDLVQGRIDSANCLPNGTGTVQGAGASQITLQTALGTANAARGCVVLIDGGTGVGQCRIVSTYSNSTKVLTVDRPWDTTPDLTSTYRVLAQQATPMTASLNANVNLAAIIGTNISATQLGNYVAGMGTLWGGPAGAATAGTANTITLQTALGADDCCVGQVIVIRWSSSNREIGVITAYDDNTQIATISADWIIQPTNGTVYVILPVSGVPSNFAITVPAAVAQASQDASVISIIRGDRLSVALPVMGNISSRTKLVWTAKLDANDTDAEAVLQVTEGTGLTRLNGAATTAAYGSLIVTNATTGASTLVIDQEATKQLEIDDLVWDAQYITATAVTSPISGDVYVTADVTRATT